MRENIVGKTFHRLTILSKPDSGHRYPCLCDCGITKSISIYDLLSGRVKSCGCLRKQRTIERNTIHGKRYLPEWPIWNGMKQRCYNPNNSCFIDYGGRGIRVCNRWRNSFTNFYADMGPRPSHNHSIDRINNDKNYTPSNCRWAVPAIQQSNRRNNVILTFNEQTKTLSEWARSINIDSKTLWLRLFKSKWTVADALTIPLKKDFLKISFNGKTKTIAEWGITTGIHPETIRYRIVRQYWPVERALTKPSRHRKKR